MKQTNFISSSRFIPFYLLLVIMIFVIACNDNSNFISDQEIAELTNLEIETRNSDDCCAEITGPNAICTSPGSPASIFCANSCCEDAEFEWSGHPSIDGLNSRCIDASGLDESVTEIHVQVKCPIDFGDLPDIPGGGDLTDYCIADGSKSIKVCSTPTFSHPNPPLELQQVCYSTLSCFDFSNATCFTNINIIDHNPGIIVSAIGSELCFKAKLCSRTNPFVGSVTLQFQGPCADGDVVTWDNIVVGGESCPECTNNPVGIDCDIVRCPCRENKDCPTGYKCGPRRYCIKK